MITGSTGFAGYPTTTMIPGRNQLQSSAPKFGAITDGRLAGQIRERLKDASGINLSHLDAPAEAIFHYTSNNRQQVDAEWHQETKSQAATAMSKQSKPPYNVLFWFQNIVLTDADAQPKPATQKDDPGLTDLKARVQQNFNRDNAEVKIFPDGQTGSVMLVQFPS